MNYVQLYWDDARWWIAGVVWDQERRDNPIPAAWLGHSEKSSKQSDGR
ncbi:MAG TPA: hypothetical protein VGK70_12100 [Thermoanaerobaculia bacterium]